MSRSPLTAFDPAVAKAIAEAHAGLEGPLLPTLHAVQDAFGCVPAEAIPVIADVLGLSRGETHGVASFYSDFRSAPPGRRRIRICRGEACQAAGGETLAEAALAGAGLQWDATAPDGSVTVEAVYCLGLCAVAPAALVDDGPVGRLDAGRLAAALR